MMGGTDPIGGINGMAAAIGGNTPDIDDDVNAAIALAAAAARLHIKNTNKNDSTAQQQQKICSQYTYSSSAIFFLISSNSGGMSHRDSFVVT